ncbi:MAG: prolipoprotein diacylglyceryl transferase [Planctomycetaceae bacterium]
MRQTLIRVFLDEPWTLWKVDAATGIPGPGVGIAILAVILVWAAIQLIRRQSLLAPERRSTLGVAAVTLIAASFAPFVAQQLGMPSLPIFGYGFMLLIGFLAGLKFGERRLRRAGLEPSLAYDLGFWLLIAGVVGARLFYLVQYADEVFANKHGLEAVKAAFKLSQGGLVLFGGLMGGAAAYFLFCYRRRINPLLLADLATPSLFIGIGFGRIGCLLNGCCYGDRCDLPWAITFPRGSVPWHVLKDRGFLDPDSLFTMPLHPTQIYSSIDGFLLAWVTVAFYPHRRHDGETFALGCILYSITRFTMEFLRGDEMGQLGTGLTISQLVSIGVLAIGLALLTFLNLRKPGRAKLTAS